MKSKSLLGLAIALFFFAACKKNDPVTEPPAKPPVEKPVSDPLELLKDSASFTIDGQKIILTTIATRGISNGKANKKLDSVVKNVEYISEDKNLFMFGRFFKLSSENRNAITVTFLKKYNKNEIERNLNTTLMVPNNKLDLLSTGEREFALDFSRDNAQDGVAIELEGNYNGLQTFGYSSLVYHPALKPELQKGSKFEVISLQKLKSGKYLLEAKFNAAVYYGDGSNIKKFENGYIRLKLNTEFLYF